MSVHNIPFGGGQGVYPGVYGKTMLIPVCFQHLAYFSWQFWLWKNVDVYTFWRGELKKYVLYTY